MYVVRYTKFSISRRPVTHEYSCVTGRYNPEKLPRIFFPSGLPNEMVAIPAAANNAVSYIIYII
jgi:hypothetical protein